MMRRWIVILLMWRFCSLMYAGNTNLYRYQLWFDQDRKGETVGLFDQNANDTVCVKLDASILPQGLHTLYYRVEDKAGNRSALSSWLFYASQMHSDSLKLQDAEYWIDKGYDRRTSVAGTHGSYSFVIDAASLSEGLHTLYYRANDSYGRYSTTNSWMFLRRALRDTSIVNAAKKLEYWFDADYKNVYTQPMDSNNIAVSISTTGLTEGLHTLNCRVQDAIGIYSSPGTWMFFKQSDVKPTRISKYRYWWNEHTDKAVIQTVNSDSTVFMFSAQLIIPDYVKTDGFSSKSTARLNVMFCDDAGNWSQVTTAEIKYPDVIPPVSEIHADKEQTTDNVTLTWNVTHDEVKDYNIYVAEDDQPYVLWIPNTSKTTAVFKGNPNTTYKFTVTARDISNNSEVLNENKFVKVEFINSDK